MKRNPIYAGLVMIVFIMTQIASAEDYRWIITYPSASNDWGKRIASGENKVVLKAQFIKITDADYKLTKFAVRPFSDYTSTWLIDSLELWKNTDHYPGSLDRTADSLISQKLVTINPQATPTNPVIFDLEGDELQLDDTTTFFVTMKFKNFHDSAPDNLEISDQNGARFGITVDKSRDDLTVSPLSKTSNSWDGNPDIYYQLRAVNLPVVVYNKNRSIAEDSIRFYPNYTALTAPGAQNQIITDLNFSAYINLPYSNLLEVGEEDRLSYASFKVSWDNTILQLDSLRYGDLWQDKAYSSEGSGFGQVEISADPQYSIVRFEGLIMDEINYVDIAHNNLAILDFRVIKPGVSPISLSEITIIDQWGIPYHIYQNLYNETESASPQYDAWAKFNLGDLVASVSSDLANGIGDGQVDVNDISLFSNYIWLNPDSADWYERFDIGSQDNHDPDVLSPDDTTNFYDLMVLATNYYRSYTGDFAQKITTRKPLAVSILTAASPSATSEYNVYIKLENLSQMACAQFKLGFDPTEVEFLGLQKGELIQKTTPQNLLIYPEISLTKGILDLNFLALSQPISGNGIFAIIRLKKLTPGLPVLNLMTADCRNVDGQPLEGQISTSGTILSEKYLTLSNYPNPFNATTVIRYKIPSDEIGNYTLQIYNLRGSLVRTLGSGRLLAGSYTQTWDGKNQEGQVVVSGLYIVSFKSKNFCLQHKILLIR